MPRTPLDPDIRRFIVTSVPSVPYLEAALLLRADDDQAWPLSRLARRLYVDERQAAELLQLLVANGLATANEDGTWRYAPPPQLAALIDRLAQAYAADLVAVTDLIHSRLDRRAQQFADAFRFRKD